jgi:hypothetical protein
MWWCTPGQASGKKGGPSESIEKEEIVLLDLLLSFALGITTSIIAGLFVEPVKETLATFKLIYCLSVVASFFRKDPFSGEWNHTWEVNATIVPDAAT